MHVEVRRQPSGVTSLLLLWALGTGLRPPGLSGKRFDLLGPLASPLPDLWKISLSLELTDLPRLLGH